MNHNLLDDQNIDSENQSSFLVEIKRVEIWLNILSTLGFVFGLGLLYGSLSTLTTEATTIWRQLLSAMVFVQGCLLFYWSYICFKYTKAVKWYQPGLISNRLEHLLEDNSRLWRATALLFFWLLCILVVVIFR